MLITITLLDLEDAMERIVGGEQPYEYKTDDSKLRILGPACGFGADSLRIYRQQGQYAESIAEAQEMAHARSQKVMGVWFVKQPRQPDQPGKPTAEVPDTVRQKGKTRE